MADDAASEGQPRELFARALSAIRASLRRDDGPFDPHRLDLRDPVAIEEVLPFFEWLARAWMKVRVSGIENLRREPTLYVANHNGGIMGPDLLCTMPMLWRALGPDAQLYAMAHDFAMRRVHALGRLLQRAGAMRAARRNAHRVFDRGGMVLAYPGGDLDAFRHYRLRDRIVFGERTGFVRVAQEAGVPIVPIVAHGAHRSSIILHEGEWLARALGLTAWSRIERFPIALGLPWGIGAGPWVPFLPLPLPISLRALPPIEAPRGEPEAVIQREIVRRMQAAMDDMASGR